MDNPSKLNETLFFIEPPPLQELCSVMLTVPIQDSSGKPLGQQPQVIRCRELIFTEPDIIATPSLSHENRVMVILQQNLYRTGKLQARFQRMGCQGEKPKRVTPADYQSCLSYTLFARMAPAWNLAGEFLIQGRDFITSTHKQNAVRFDLRVTEEKMYISLVPTILKSQPAKLSDLGILTPVAREFMCTKPEAVIREYSIENKWCHILPSMKRGKVINVHHTLPKDSPFKSYKDLKKHWKNSYGYRLPEDDSNLLYYQVYFKLVGEMLFTYPDVCIRPRPALTFPRADPAPILSAFLADLAARLPAACGQSLRLVRDPAYTTPTLLRPTDQVEARSAQPNSGPNLTDTAPITKYGYRPLNPPAAAKPTFSMSQQQSQGQPSHTQTSFTQRNPTGPLMVSGGTPVGASYSEPSRAAPAGEAATRIVPSFSKRPTASQNQGFSQFQTSQSRVMPSQGPRSVPVFKANLPQRGPQTSASSSGTKPTFSRQIQNQNIPMRGPVVTPVVRRDTSNNHGSPLPAMGADSMPASAPSFTPRPMFGRGVMSQKAPVGGAVGASRLYQPAPGVQRQMSSFGHSKQIVTNDLVGPSQPQQSKRSTEGKEAQPKKRTKVQENLDVEELARLGQLAKANTATLLAWLRAKGVPCRAKDKKAELAEKVLQVLALAP